MNKKVIILIVILIIIVCGAGIFIYFYSNKFSSLQFIENTEFDKKYIEGQIIVGFFDNITENKAIDLIHYNNLEWHPASPEWNSSIFIKLDYKPEISAEEGWDMRVNMSKQITDYDKEINKEKSIIFSSEAYSSQIFIQFNQDVSLETAEELLKNFDELEINELILSMKFMAVTVPEGKEKYWIEILEKERIVEYAELNFIIDNPLDYVPPESL